MTEKLKQIIKEEIAKLPQENQEAVSSLEWVRISEEIARKYISDEEGLNNFLTEVLLVLLGLEEASIYVSNIEDNVGTTKEDANKIAEEVLKKVFIPVNDVLLQKIKRSDKVKTASWLQNIDFILSAGDYRSFMERKDIQEPVSAIAQDKETIQSNLEKTFGVKDKLVI